MSSMRRIKKDGFSPTEGGEPVAIEPLNEFERHLLLLAKHHYRYDGDYADGARAIAGHIAGIPMKQVNFRDVAGWLVHVMVWIDRNSPHALAGGMARALTEFLDRLGPPVAATARPMGEYWRLVVEGLMGQIAIAKIKKNDETFYQMPVIDLAIQATLADTIVTPDNIPLPEAVAPTVTTISVPVITGVQVMKATPDQLNRVKTAAYQVYAELLGFSCAADYREWIDSSGTIYCVADAGNGQRCNKRVRSKNRLSPGLWIKARNSKLRCYYHGGE